MSSAHTPSQKEFSWKRALLVSSGVAVAVLFVSVVLQSSGLNIGLFNSDLFFSSASTSTKQIGSSFEMPAKPSRLIIPSIGVDAHIQQVGLAWQGTGDMGIPTNFTDVAWYKDGPRPGAPGSAVIDGHLDGRTVARAVFYDLAKLKVGDMVEVVDADGKSLNFKVTRVKTFAYQDDATEVFSKEVTTPRLNLITCTGDWLPDEHSYTDRTVVFTELVTSSNS